jgi:hypothetical protein
LTDGLLRAAVRELLDRGLITADDIHTGGLLARDRSRSHGVAVVELGTRPGFVVKSFRTDGADDLQGSLDREQAVYRVAADHPDLRTHLPPVFGGPGEGEPLVLGVVAEAVTATEWFRRSSLYDAGLARLVGHQLGLWHRASAVVGGEGIKPSPRWLHRVFGPDPPEFVLNNQPVHDWVVAFPRPETASRLLEEAAHRWRPSAVVHGDLRFDNCLVTVRGSEATVTFVDWEQAGWGDPAWDVACLVQDYLTHGGHTTMLFPLDHRLRGALGDLVDGHRVAAGDLGSDYLERVVSFTGAKLVHRALQLVAWQAGTTGDADRHGALGLELLEHPELGMSLLSSER